MLCPIFPAVHHRLAEVHWRGFTFAGRTWTRFALDGFGSSLSGVQFVAAPDGNEHIVAGSAACDLRGNPAPNQQLNGFRRP